MPLWQSIGISQVSTNFRVKYIGIGSGKKWYWCITNDQVAVSSSTDDTKDPLVLLPYLVWIFSDPELMDLPPEASVTPPYLGRGQDNPHMLS